MELENGQTTYNDSMVQNNGYPLNTVASFTCNPGYNLNGSDSSTCQDSLNWDQQIPACDQGKNVHKYET